MTSVAYVASVAGELQLAMALDTDHPEPGELEAIEAAVLHQERDKARWSTQSRPCRCGRPIPERWPGGFYVDIKCGHHINGRAS
jgi:hypothetical protein